jgi:type IV pilus assembly protein PilN
MLVATRKETITERQELIESVGIKPVVIDIESQAMITALLYQNALSNARVSELLRNLSQAPKQLSMGQPELIEVKAVNYGQGKDLRKLFDFTLSIPVAAE